MRKILTKLILASAACALTACGGGGGGGGSGLVSTPTPIPAPVSGNVDIFPSPASQEFVTVGIGDDLRIRYDAATNRYEVMAEGRGWEVLVDDPNFVPQSGDPNMMFVFAGTVPNQSYFMIRARHSFSNPSVRYRYSNLAVWGRLDSLTGTTGVGGYTAFGIPTPAAGVPTVGSATYQGLIEGVSTMQFPYEGQSASGLVGGTVTLNFDFGAGTLGGNINPIISAEGSHNLGPIAFAAPVFAAGSTSFSGTFATSVAGPNAFSGIFTGPNAQELIGKWAFPFISPTDGKIESAQGAWIAKRP